MEISGVTLAWVAAASASLGRLAKAQWRRYSRAGAQSGLWKECGRAGIRSRLRPGSDLLKPAVRAPELTDDHRAVMRTIAD